MGRVRKLLRRRKAALAASFLLEEPRSGRKFMRVVKVFLWLVFTVSLVPCVIVMMGVYLEWKSSPDAGMGSIVALARATQNKGDGLSAVVALLSTFGLLASILQLSQNHKAEMDAQRRQTLPEVLVTPVLNVPQFTWDSAAKRITSFSRPTLSFLVENVGTTAAHDFTLDIARVYLVATDGTVTDLQIFHDGFASADRVFYLSRIGADGLHDDSKQTLCEIELVTSEAGARLTEVSAQENAGPAAESVATKQDNMATIHALLNGIDGPHQDRQQPAARELVIEVRAHCRNMRKVEFMAEVECVVAPANKRWSSLRTGEDNKTPKTNGRWFEGVAHLVQGEPLTAEPDDGEKLTMLVRPLKKNFWSFLRFRNHS